jgi:hypothetical protein
VVPGRSWGRIGGISGSSLILLLVRVVCLVELWLQISMPDAKRADIKTEFSIETYLLLLQRLTRTRCVGFLTWWVFVIRRSLCHKTIIARNILVIEHYVCQRQHQAR